MTVVPITARPVPAARGRAVLLPLVAQETRRLLRHPVTLVGWAIFAGSAVHTVVWVGRAEPRTAYEAVEMLISFFPGIFLILSANLVASRDHRAGSDELLAAVPVRSDRRTAAQLLAAVPVALLGLAAVLVVHVAQLALDLYDGRPGAGQILQGPLTLGGAVCLGVMVARWSRARAAVLLTIVTMVMLNIWLNGMEERGAYFAPMFNWAEWGVFSGTWAGVFPGSPLWRLGYLAGLVGLAALGAMLPVSRRPRSVVGAGTAVLAVTALCGWRMLP